MTAADGANRVGFWVALTALVALACCAAPAPPGWTKLGASSAERSRDLADCERVATGEAGFHFRALNQTYEQARDEIPRRKAECLRDRGWSEEK